MKVVLQVKVVLYLLVLISFWAIVAGTASASYGFYFFTNATKPINTDSYHPTLPLYYVPSAPYVIATEPQNNAVNVPVNKPVAIVFSQDVNFGIDQWGKFSTAFDIDAMRKTLPEGIKLQNYSTPGKTVLHDATWPNVIWFYADSEGPWPSDATILITIQPGAVFVEDRHNTTSDMVWPARFPDVKNVQNYTLRFTTQAGLAPTGLVYPGKDTSKMPLDPEIKVLFNHDIVPGPFIMGNDMYANITLRPIVDAILDKNGKRINPTATPVPILKTIAANSLTIEPNNTMLTPSTNYAITLPGGCLRAADDKDKQLYLSLIIPFSTMKTNDTTSKDVPGGAGDGDTSGTKGASPSSGSELAVVLAPLMIMAVAVLRSRFGKR